MEKATKKKSTIQDVYTRMKNSIQLPTTPTPPAVAANLSSNDYTVGNTVEECRQNIKHVNTVISKTKQKLIQYYCNLGLELIKYKLLSITKYCSKCAINQNEAALSCHACVKMKSNRFELNAFMKFSCETLNCTHDWVNFLISLGRLSKQYPKFKYVTLSLMEIKGHMKVLTTKMNAEPDFWNM